MQPPNFSNLMVKYPVCFGSVASLYKALKSKAGEYEYRGQNRSLAERPGFVAKVAALRAIAERVKTAESVEAVSAILAENNLQFMGSELIDDSVNKLGGKSKKGKSKKGKSKKSKSKKGKSRKNKTRRKM